MFIALVILVAGLEILGLLIWVAMTIREKLSPKIELRKYQSRLAQR